MKRKLTLEKFRISQFKNLSKITGGTANDAGADPTNAQDTENTTYTTDPNVPCPANAPTFNTGNHPNKDDRVPTFGDAIP